MTLCGYLDKELSAPVFLRNSGPRGIYPFLMDGLRQFFVTEGLNLEPMTNGRNWPLPERYKIAESASNQPVMVRERAQP